MGLTVEEVSRAASLSSNASADCATSRGSAGLQRSLGKTISVTATSASSSQSTTSSTLSPWQTVIAGSFAGLTSRVVIAPLDVIKIRFQLQTEPKSFFGSTSTSPKYISLTQAFRLIIKEEGILGFWKGNLSAELLYLTYGGSQFLFYSQTQKALLSTYEFFGEEPRKSLVSFVSGAVGGALATTVSYPFDLLRTRFAAQREPKIYKSVMGAVRMIYRGEGLLGFYKGLSPSIAQIIPYMGIMFTSYEALRERARWIKSSKLWNSHYDSVLDAGAGGIAGVFSKLCTMPFDTVRKRLQVHGPDPTVYVVPSTVSGTANAIQVSRNILVKEGILGFFKGSLPAILKAAPSSAVTFGAFD